MTKTIDQHEGKKYLRRIQSAVTTDTVHVDIYAVIVAFNITCPGRQQAIKKLLDAGNRGKGSALDDLIGAEAALSRAIELEKGRCAVPPAIYGTVGSITLKRTTQVEDPCEQSAIDTMKQIDKEVLKPIPVTSSSVTLGPLMRCGGRLHSMENKPYYQCLKCGEFTSIDLINGCPRMIQIVTNEATSDL